MPTTKDKLHTHDLDEARADELLKNVLASCNMAPTAVPLKIIHKTQNYKTERFIIQKIAIISFLAFLLLIPFAFAKPAFSIFKATENSTSVDDYVITIHSLLPVNRIVAAIDGTPINVRSGDNSDMYVVTPPENGLFTVSVTGLNGQTTIKELNIVSIDTKEPNILSFSVKKPHFYFIVQDFGCGVAYDQIRAYTDTGEIILPKSYDNDSGKVVFDLYKGSLNLFVPDLNGNTLQTVLTF